MLGFNTTRIGKVITDWLVENMNPDMTPYVMSLDFIVYYQNKHKKTPT